MGECLIEKNVMLMMNNLWIRNYMYFSMVLVGSWKRPLDILTRTICFIKKHGMSVKTEVREFVYCCERGQRIKESKQQHLATPLTTCFIVYAINFEIVTFIKALLSQQEWYSTSCNAQKTVGQSLKRILKSKLKKISLILSKTLLVLTFQIFAHIYF